MTSRLPRARASRKADATRWEGSRVSLLRSDVELRGAIPLGQLAAALPMTVVPRIDIPSGRWSPPELDAPAAAIVLHGTLIRDLVLGGRKSAHLLGPGDIADPYRPMETRLPASTEWASPRGTTLALLDRNFKAAAKRWPALAAVIRRRLAFQLRQAEMQAAIAALPRVEQRLLALFWQFAERWGTPGNDWVLIDLALTHELLGRLAGAERPTVSIALTNLKKTGLLTRTQAGAWKLESTSAHRLEGAWARPVADESEP